MSIINIFSKRQKKIRGEVPEIFTFDLIPEKFRVQIIHIIRDAIGELNYEYDEDYPRYIYGKINLELSKEYGVFSLGKGKSQKEIVLNYLLEESNTEKVIDAVELSFRNIDFFVRKKYFGSNSYNINQSPDDAIEELNQRFKENGIGYSYASGEIIRVDSTLIHENITKPTLTLLHNSKLSGANEEFLKAHEHYRHSRNKECLAECLKAFESTLKIICTEKGWEFNNDRDTSNRLIQICFDNGLVPSYIQTQFTSLQSLLTSGIPTIRNRVGGHGQGQTPIPASNEITRYGLNLTGTNIIYLVEQSGI
tara:strand:+ start:2701 stop:3624 length:924 start_codon:yes stop_codon:yes gene_type:complete